MCAIDETGRATAAEAIAGVRRHWELVYGLGRRTIAFVVLLDARRNIADQIATQVVSRNTSGEYFEDLVRAYGLLAERVARADAMARVA